MTKALRTRTDVQRALDRAVADDGVPGAVAAIHDGADGWFGAAGVADLQTGRPRQRADRFRVGSITKALTATVVLRQVAEGLLSLDDTVERWLPGLVHGLGHDGRRITVRALLNQTSGVFNYSVDQEMLDRFTGLGQLDHLDVTYRPEEIVALAMRHPPAFEPGTAWAYSNTNYVLAGMVAERVGGRPLAEEVEQRIARPLGLTGTYLPGAETALRGQHGRHYTRLDQPGPQAPAHDVTELNPSYAWAAGGAVSTVDDLGAFFGALLGGRLLPRAQQQELLTVVPTTGWLPGTGYGLGVFSQLLPCGTTVWGGGGAINGSWSYAMGTRDGSRMLVANVNGDWNDPILRLVEIVGAEFCGS